MSCNITAGRQEVCKDSIGGLQGVYFINFESGSFTKNAGGEVTDLSGQTVYYYELKGTSAYTETVNSSRENGTTFFSQETTLNLKKLTNEMTTQLKLLAYGRPQIIVWTNSGDALLVGEEHGADLTAGTIQTGGALGDLYGYSITMTGEEKLPAAFLSGSTSTDPFSNLVGAPTIVYS
tara:strand:+ start:7807 stop:8340 length:534 start_codon:yes stop_codon:yes gene_type:complete